MIAAIDRAASWGVAVLAVVGGAAIVYAELSCLVALLRGEL